MPRILKSIVVYVRDESVLFSSGTNIEKHFRSCYALKPSRMFFFLCASVGVAAVAISADAAGVAAAESFSAAICCWCGC